MVEVFPLTETPPRERFESFCATIDQVFCPMSIEPGGAGSRVFDASIRMANLGTLRLAHVASTRCSVRRRPEDIARIGDPAYLVKFQLRGRAIWSQRHREVHLNPGDFVIASTTEPYSLRFLEDYSMPVLALSDAVMRDICSDPEQFLGVRMSGEDADCGLLSSFVGQVITRLGRLTAPVLTRSEANILDLLRAVLAARAKRRSIPLEEQRRAIKTFVRQHLTDHRLSAAMIAQEFGITPRYVHTLFRAESMTIGRYIRSVRLDACRRALEAPTSERQSLTEVALSFGFYDLSHMSRCFREAFDVSPTEVRSGVLRAQDRSGDAP